MTEPNWIATSLSQVARFFGVSTKTISHWKNRGMPAVPKAYNLSEIAAWRLQYEREQSRRQVDEALLKADSQSPALERFRAARAALSEIELAERQEELLPLSLIQPFHNQLAHYIREAGEIMKRNGHTDAHEILNEQIEMLEADINKFHEEHGGPETAG